MVTNKKENLIFLIDIFKKFYLESSMRNNIYKKIENLFKKREFKIWAV